jgi:hypothetical protein
MILPQNWKLAILNALLFASVENTDKVSNTHGPHVRLMLWLWNRLHQRIINVLIRVHYKPSHHFDQLFHR